MRGAVDEAAGPALAAERVMVFHGTMSTRHTYQRVARLYDLLDLPFEYRRYRPLRRALWTGTGGRILDAGVGTGRNMDFYPGGSDVTGIDISPAMLERARRRLARTGAASPVTLREMDVMATDFPDRHFDFVISSFLFCVLDADHQLPALRELARITKADGEIRVLEYSYSNKPLKRWVMKLWAPWVRWAYGAAFDRNTERYVEAAGLSLVEERFLFEDIIKVLVLRVGEQIR